MFIPWYFRTKVCSFSSFIEPYQTHIVTAQMLFDCWTVKVAICHLLSNSVTLSVGFVLKLWSAWWSDFTEILTWWSDTYVFILATWKNFPITEDFSTAKKRKNKAVFRNFETSVNLYEIFYVMKVVGKIRVGIFHIDRTVDFHFHPLLEFSDFRFGSY